MTDRNSDMRAIMTRLMESAAPSHMANIGHIDDLFEVLLSLARGQNPARTVMIYAPRGKAQELRDALEEHFASNTVGHFTTRLNFRPVFDVFRPGNTFFAGCYARAKDANPSSTPIFVSDDPRMEKFSNSRAQARILWINARGVLELR